MAELLPWLNLLLIPTCMGVLTIHGRLSKLEANHQALGARLSRLDGIKNN